MFERHDDVGAGTRHLLAADDAAQRRYGIRGLVRDVLEVDREVERAVEAVLADRAEALVVESAEGAISALEALRDSRAGCGVFLATPPEDVQPRGLVPLGQPLLERVRPSPGYEQVARALLGGVNLVDDLREAVRIYGRGRLPASFVTREGDLLTPDGVARGGGEGRQGRKPGHLARGREIRDLDAEVAELEARVGACERAQREARERWSGPPTSSRTSATAIIRRRWPWRTTRRMSSARASA